MRSFYVVGSDTFIPRPDDEDRPGWGWAWPPPVNADKEYEFWWNYLRCFWPKSNTPKEQREFILYEQHPYLYENFSDNKCGYKISLMANKTIEEIGTRDVREAGVWHVRPQNMHYFTMEYGAVPPCGGGISYQAYEEGSGVVGGQLAIDIILQYANRNNPIKTECRRLTELPYIMRQVSPTTLQWLKTNNTSLLHLSCVPLICKIAMQRTYMLALVLLLLGVIGGLIVCNYRFKIARALQTHGLCQSVYNKHEKYLQKNNTLPESSFTGLPTFIGEIAKYC